MLTKKRPRLESNTPRVYVFDELPEDVRLEFLDDECLMLL